MPFPIALGQSGMQTTSTRIWTKVTNSISYVDNR